MIPHYQKWGQTTPKVFQNRHQDDFKSPKMRSGTLSGCLFSKNSSHCKKGTSQESYCYRLWGPFRSQNRWERHLKNMFYFDEDSNWIMLHFTFILEPFWCPKWDRAHGEKPSKTMIGSSKSRVRPLTNHSKSHKKTYLEPTHVFWSLVWSFRLFLWSLFDIKVLEKRY